MAYFAKKTTVDGFTFQSHAEAARYAELKLLEQAGEIIYLQVHSPWELEKGVKIEGEARKRPPLRYVDDFYFVDAATGGEHVEDVKGKNGHMTPVFRLKQHLMQARYGISVEVVRR